MESNFFNDTVDPKTGAAPSTLENINIVDDTPGGAMENALDMFVIDLHGKPEYITKKEALSIVCQLNAQMMIEYDSMVNDADDN